MRTIFLIITFFLIKAISFSQEFNDNYLGPYYKPYKGCLFKLTDKASHLDFCFYDKIDRLDEPLNSKVLYPTKEYKFVTNADKLRNRIFKLNDITTKPAGVVFTLQDTLTNEVIYFKYDSTYFFNFPFLTTVSTFDTEAICNSITKKFDDFTDEKTYRTPLIEGANYEFDISFLKVVSRKSTSFFMRLNCYGPTLVVDGKKVIVLFTDGEKWEKDTDIKASVQNKDQYKYTAFIELTADELKMFQQKKINKYRLYIFDKQLRNADAERYKILAGCIETIN